MGDAARRLRARHDRRLIPRFACGTFVLTLGAFVGWTVGLPATVAVATLGVGVPAVALIRHLVGRERGRHRTVRGARRRPMRRPRDADRTLVRGM